MEEISPMIPDSKPGFPKSSILFVVAVILAVLVGGWFYVDIVRQGLQTQIDLLGVSQGQIAESLSVLKATDTSQSVVSVAESTLPEGWTRVSGVLGGHEFSMLLPPDHWVDFISVVSPDDAMNILPLPTQSDPEPLSVMVVNASGATGKDAIDADKVVTADDGTRFFIFRPARGDWDAFQEVADSFTIK